MLEGGERSLFCKGVGWGRVLLLDLDVAVGMLVGIQVAVVVVVAVGFWSCPCCVWRLLRNGEFVGGVQSLVDLSY